VGGDHARALVLGEGAETGRGRAALLLGGKIVGVLVARQDHAEEDAVDFTQVDEVQRRPLGGRGEHPYLGLRRAVLWAASHSRTTAVRSPATTLSISARPWIRPWPHRPTVCGTGTIRPFEASAQTCAPGCSRSSASAPFAIS